MMAISGPLGNRTSSRTFSHLECSLWRNTATFFPEPVCNGTIPCSGPACPGLKRTFCFTICDVWKGCRKCCISVCRRLA